MTIEEQRSKIWECSDGRRVTVESMSTYHITNAVKLLKRRGFISNSQVHAFFCIPYTKDNETYQYRRDRDKMLNGKVHDMIDIFDKELYRRSGKQEDS